jgi:hypothetical protein
MAVGTLTLADLQATQNASFVAKVGLDVTFDAIQNTLEAHSRIAQGLMTELAERTTDEARRYGGDDSMAMEDADETTVPRAQKVAAGSTVGFPLNSVMIGQQWTDMWFRKHTIEELAAQVNGIMSADIRRIARDLKRAFFFSANYTHTDHLARNIDLAVKRLVNADSAPIPPGPNGEAFVAATHTHYLARVGGALAATDLDALINTVKEHYSTGEIRVYINTAQESTVNVFTGFVQYPDPRIALSYNVNRPVGRTLDVVNLYNRAIGIYNGAEFFVRPWVPANYIFAFNAAAPKPLCYRYDPDYGDGLMLVKDEDQYPWQARGFRRVFGIGTWNRINGAVLYTGNTSYTNPTIN